MKTFAPIPVSVLSTNSVTRDVRKAALDGSPCDVSTIEAILFYDSQLYNLPFPKLDNMEKFDFKEATKKLIWYVGNPNEILNQKNKFVHLWCSLIAATHDFYEDQTNEMFLSYPTQATFSPKYPDLQTRIAEVPALKIEYIVKANNDNTPVNVTVDSQDLVEMFTKAEVLDAKALVCINMMRIHNKDPDHLLVHLNGRLYSQFSQFTTTERYKNAGIPFTKEAINATKEAFRGCYDPYRRILAALLHRNVVTNHKSSEKFVAFFNYAVKTPIAYVGMHLIKFLHTAVGQSQNLATLFDMVRELNNSILNSQIDRLESIKLIHGLVAQQSQSLATVQPAMVNQTINWFPFCKALDSRFHAELAASANKELCCLLIGMQPSRQEESTKIWALKGFAQINE